MKKIQDFDVSEKKILIRTDFNVEIKDADVKEKFKIAACKDSIDYLMENGAGRIVLMSHLGRPEGKRNLQYSLEQIRDDVERIIGRPVVFCEDCIGGCVSEGMSKLKDGEVLLLENTRFYEGDEKNDPEFAKRLAENFDVFVNDAFSVCHRDQASVTGVTKFLPSFAGLWLQKEIHQLDKALHEPQHPATAIIGGAKIETKLPLIQRFEKIYDHVLVGGKVANEAIDQKIAFSPKVILPIDFAENRFDIGPETIRRFKEIIVASKIVIWNGPMGKFEEPPFDQGTRQILDIVAESDMYTLVGGGESVQVLEERNLMGSISFVSTGGGAMLEYLSGNSMPGIEVLNA
jgi:3-phosphoglycerate kinase